MSSRVQHIEIDLTSITSEEQLHTLLMRRLEFPHYYGKNWNAFWDVITEPDRLPHVLTFPRWSEFQHRLPEAARELRDCLERASAMYSYVDCRIEYA